VTRRGDSRLPRKLGRREEPPVAPRPGNEPSQAARSLAARGHGRALAARDHRLEDTLPLTAACALESDYKEQVRAWCMMRATNLGHAEHGQVAGLNLATFMARP